MTEQRDNANVILVSDLLPIQIVEDEEAKCLFQTPVGATITALDGLMENSNYVWIGQLRTCPNPESLHVKESKDELLKRRMISVDLNKTGYAQFHEDFCRGILWPHFHYIMPFITQCDEHWTVFYEINKKFADVICQAVHDLDCKYVWIHGFQLLLLPGILRERIPELAIGHFLHVPFPSYETFRSLPWRESILKSLLSADLIGMQTAEYYRHFLSSVEHLFDDCFIQGNLIIFNNHTVNIEVFPMPVDYTELANKALQATIKYNCIDHGANEVVLDQTNHQEANTYLNKIRRKNHGILARLKHNNRKVIFSLCKMDYLAGLVHTIKAYKRLLQRFPEYIEKVVLLVVVADVEKEEWLDELRTEVCRLIGSVNAHFTSSSWEPIKYISQILPKLDILNIYVESDICLVAPLRDGMNMVCKEYLAAKEETGEGVLILSEFAGAAEQLDEALLVNPYDENDMVIKLKAALEMNRNEQISLMRKLQKRISTEKVLDWANHFLLNLKSSAMLNSYTRSNVTKLREKWIKEINNDFKQCSAIIFGFGRCSILVENNIFIKNNVLLKCSDLWNLIIKLASIKRVIIVSHEDKTTLEQWFPIKSIKTKPGTNLSIELISDGGHYYRYNDFKWQPVTKTNIKMKNWKSCVRRIFTEASKSVPGTFISESCTSMSWNYGNLSNIFGRARARLLIDHLAVIAIKYHLNISHTQHILQVSQNNDINYEIIKNSSTLNRSIIAVCDKFSQRIVHSMLNSKHKTDLATNTNSKTGNTAKLKIINIVQFAINNITDNIIPLKDVLGMIERFVGTCTI